MRPDSYEDFGALQIVTVAYLQFLILDGNKLIWIWTWYEFSIITWDLQNFQKLTEHQTHRRRWISGPERPGESMLLPR